MHYRPAAGPQPTLRPATGKPTTGRAMGGPGSRPPSARQSGTLPLSSPGAPSSEFVAMTWAEYHERVGAFAAACVALGLPIGGAIGIASENRPEWLIAALGAMAAGGMVAGIYQTSTAEQTAHILAHSDSMVAVLEDQQQWAKIAPAVAEGRLPRLRRVVFLGEVPEAALAAVSAAGGPLGQSFADFLASGSGPFVKTAEERQAALQPDQVATLIYTSGTTGVPKGVMLSHQNLAWTASCAVTFLEFSPRDVLVSYLPLSHIAEQMLSLYVPVSSGAQIYFAGGLDRLKETLVVARPTVFLGVPRVWEKFQAALQKKFDEASTIQRRVIAWARDVGQRVGGYRIQHGRPFGLLVLEELVAQRLFFSRLKAALGLDRVRVAVSGAAAIRREVLDFFLTLQIPIHEVYGQSECAGPATYNFSEPGGTRLGTVGKVIPGGALRIADDGEILYQGPNVFLGYFKDPVATAESLLDGWLHTGDIGTVDEDGFLRITDRKKDLFKTVGGKYIAPQPLEGMLRTIPGISQAVIIGEGRRYVTALLTLELEQARAIARQHGLTITEPAELAKNSLFRDYVLEQIERINKGLARYETIKRFLILPRDFTVENDEMTPSQKLRRRIILSRYAREIDELYAAPAGESGDGEAG